MTLWRCIICGSDNPPIHKFPANIQRRKAWIEALGAENKDTSFYENKRICGRHFSREAYAHSQSNFLNPNALPNLIPRRPTAPFSFSLPTNYAAVPGTSHCPIPQDLSSLFGDQFVVQCTNNDVCREKHLIRALNNKRKNIRTLKKKCRKQKEKLNQLLSGDAEELINSIFKNMSVSSKKFMFGQLKAAKCAPKGRRWTFEEKVSSLLLFKKSPRSYDLLRRFLVLPCPKTLTRLLSKVPFQAGINAHLFQHLGRCLNSYKEEERICSLVFDEISIREHIQYNSSLDELDGAEDLGNRGRRSRIANYALVFMVQGVVGKWKQPVAYYFTHGSICAEELEPIIRDVIDSLLTINVKVIATICDMGAANVRALRIMGSSVLQPFFLHRGSKVFTIFDPPHLLKCTRNLLLKYPISFLWTIADHKTLLTARWSHIKTMYEVEKNKRSRLQSVRKLTDQHLAPMMQSKMKVSLAAQVLSQGVAANLETFIVLGGLPPDAIGTSTFVLLMNDLFDSFNGNSSSLSEDPTQSLKSSVSQRSDHLKFWDEAYKCIQSWSFV